MTGPSPPGPAVIVIAPDSFKGSLPAGAVAAAMAEGILRALPAAQLRLRPMADGGEGTLDALLAAAPPGAARVVASRHAVQGAAGGAVEAAVAVRASDRTGIVEVAQVVGLTDVAAMAVDVTQRHTRGVGELLAQLLDGGCTRLLVGLGGSSTNDGGAGLLAALGVRFLDRAGTGIAPTPQGLEQLHRVDIEALDPRIATCAITIMSDVNNPLTGAAGATAVFGPQKGVTAAAVAGIDATLLRYAQACGQAFGRTVEHLPGAGAAGGLGYALLLLGATFRSGAEVVADSVGLDAALDGAAWAITGEGRSDAQTAMRKAPWVVAERGHARGVPVSLLSGALDSMALPLLNSQFRGCFALPPGPATLDASLAQVREWLADRAEAMARLRFC